MAAKAPRGKRHAGNTAASQGKFHACRQARAPCEPVQGCDAAAGAGNAHHDPCDGECCAHAIREYLETGESAVGTAVDVRHLAATPLGQQVTAEAEVIEVDGRRIVFAVTAC